MARQRFERLISQTWSGCSNLYATMSCTLIWYICLVYKSCAVFCNNISPVYKMSSKQIYCSKFITCAKMLDPLPLAMSSLSSQCMSIEYMTLIFVY